MKLSAEGRLFSFFFFFPCEVVLRNKQPRAQDLRSSLEWITCKYVAGKPKVTLIIISS